MSRRTFEDWKTLVEKQIASELSVPQFCHQYRLNPNYFYSRKSMVCKESNNAGFIQAQIMTTQKTQVYTTTEQSIKLSTSTGELSLPANTSATFIAELLNGLRV